MRKDKCSYGPCGKPIHPMAHERAEYCSARCRKLAWDDRLAKEYKRLERIRKRGWSFDAAERASYEWHKRRARKSSRRAECQRCKAPMPGARAGQRFCSGRCRVAAHRAKAGPAATG